MVALNLPRFELGEVVSTPDALQALERAKQSAGEFLDRHVRGDWGAVSDDDQQCNEQALGDGGRIFSAYLLASNQKLWIITEAVGDDGRRESTCLMLPEEY